MTHSSIKSMENWIEFGKWIHLKTYIKKTNISTEFSVLKTAEGHDPDIGHGSTCETSDGIFQNHELHIVINQRSRI